MTTHISAKFGQFQYYDLQLKRPDWKNSTVLDFGGNVGNILKDQNSTIDHCKYWSLDVSKDAIERGRREFPQAHWLYYNRYNFSFNPDGVQNLELPFQEERFDLILAYSVFTHIGLKEMLSLVKDLLRLLRPGGRLAFSFIDHNYWSWPGEYDGNNLKWRLEKIIERGDRNFNVQDYLGRARHAHWCTLVDDVDLYIETEELANYLPNIGKSFHVYHSAEFMQELYPDAEILPPANREMQHCCLMGSRDTGFSS
jgi:SAM-dependent methyltransferase